MTMTMTEIYYDTQQVLYHTQSIWSLLATPKRNSMGLRKIPMVSQWCQWSALEATGGVQVDVP